MKGSVCFLKLCVKKKVKLKKMVRSKWGNNHFCVNYSFSFQLITFQMEKLPLFGRLFWYHFLSYVNYLPFCILLLATRSSQLKSFVDGYLMAWHSWHFLRLCLTIQHWLEVLNTSGLPLFECFSPSKAFDWKTKTTLKMWIRPHLSSPLSTPQEGGNQALRFFC